MKENKKNLLKIKPLNSLLIAMIKFKFNLPGTSNQSEIIFFLQS